MDNELTLVSRILSGDAEAWEEFCEVYGPIVERSLRRYISDPETRRDLYVSLLEKLRRDKLGSFAGRSTLAAWLFVVVRNHCRDYYRSEGGVRRLSCVFKDLSPEETARLHESVSQVMRKQALDGFALAEELRKLLAGPEGVASQP